MKRQALHAGHALGLGDYSDSEPEDEEAHKEGLEGGALVAGFDSGDEQERGQAEFLNDDDQATCVGDTITAADVEVPSGDAGILQALPEALRQPPPGEVALNVMAKVEKLFYMRRTHGKTLNEALRKNRDIRNPDLLQSLVNQNGLDQYGSAFEKEKFDPLDEKEEDRIASLIGQLQREQERRNQAREQIRPDQLRAGTAIEFQRGQPIKPVVPAASIPMPGQAAINQMLANAAATAAAAAANGAKRSKWDSSVK